MSASVAEPGYVRDLEENLQLLLFGAEATADVKAAVLLVRGALARGDRIKAAQLAQSTECLSRRWTDTPARTRAPPPSRTLAS